MTVRYLSADLCKITANKRFHRVTCVNPSCFTSRALHVLPIFTLLLIQIIIFLSCSTCAPFPVEHVADYGGGRGCQQQLATTNEHYPTSGRQEVLTHTYGSLRKAKHTNCTTIEKLHQNDLWNISVTKSIGPKRRKSRILAGGSSQGTQAEQFCYLRDFGRVYRCHD